MEDDFRAALAEAKAHRRAKLVGFSLACLAVFLVVVASIAVKGFVRLVPLVDGLEERPALLRLELGPGGFQFGRDKVLLLAQKVRVAAEYEGYLPVETTAVAGSTRLDIALVKRPVTVEVLVAPAVVQLYLNGQAVPIHKGVARAELAPGPHDYRLVFENGAAEQGRFEAVSMGPRLDLGKLQPMRTLSIEGEGVSEVLVCGASVPGQKALLIPADCGEITVFKGGTELRFSLERVAGSSLLTDDASLVTVRVDGLPSNAAIDPKPMNREGGALLFAKPLPFTLTVVAPGYRKAAFQIEKPAQTVDMGKSRIKVPVKIISSPTAILSGGSGEIGRTPLSLDLPFGSHDFVASAKGMAQKELTVDISSEAPQEILVELEALTAFLRRTEPVRYVPPGLSSPLIRISGSEMVLGSAAGERGAKADEVRRPVSFARDFYLGAWEVSEEDFSAFDPRVTPSDKPVVGISWEQAARYCNWLSQQSGLDSFYVFRGEAVVAINQSSRGFRLPSEAEWEYVAGMHRREFKTIFPWGNRYQIAAYAGNIADNQAKQRVRKYIADYDDGYSGRSPVQEGPDLYGFRNLAGNAAEWVHDSYLLAPSDEGKVYRDYLGPGLFDRKVIKGSSFMTGEGSNMRVAARRASDTPVSDVGFRVARYVF